MPQTAGQALRAHPLVGEMARAGKSAAEVRRALAEAGVTCAERTLRTAVAVLRAGKVAPAPQGSPRAVPVLTSVFLSDAHVPYEDPGAVDVALQLMAHLAPTHVFLVGDMLDCYALSRFDRDPNRTLRLQDDIDRLGALLSRIRKAAPLAAITYIEGNHENRIMRWLWQHPEVCNLRVLQPPDLLGLGAHGVAWVGQDTTHQFHEFIITHGTVVRKLSAYSARAEFEKFHRSGVSGHTHRSGVYRHTDFSGEYVWQELGCLCRLDPEYVQRPNWQHGLAVGRFVADGLRFSIEPVHIVERKMLYGDLLFDGQGAVGVPCK